MFEEQDFATGAQHTAHFGQDLPLLIDSVRRAHGRELDVEWQAPAGALALERDDMLELLGNLLDNACKWARSAVRLRCLLYTSPSPRD